MKIALLAATGRAGLTILAELVARGHSVVAVARNPSKLPEPLPGTVQVVRDDLGDAERLAQIIAGVDAVVSAFGPATSDPRFTTDTSYTDQLVEVTERVIAAVDQAAIPRLLVVGGAGSLQFSPGVRVLESGHWPAPYVPIATSHVKAFAALRASTIDWTYFSPPILIQPGERTGKFRLGKDDLIRDADGKSHVSFEDYAVAVVDELEQPQNRRARFTVGY
ncbi:NAD(P)-dependent oxidoreductase [Paraburkholderia tropica]|uniref:NAD(P)-binding domain-containing protein n=1 Tax=Paraburkholderia tropica TaxID=92647 RepID=A0A1A5XKU4_9BURK|nr:NAD(P)-dependent oxidoreductase [Paraburkholderia tropica]MBB2982173.1 hypothetical protein [Paraburkholderia tropica]OBR54131.1 epimerase [Paraburkholderia tropica]RQN36844.1 NAD(P)-dependent oxidoreductase [Paraburkholderia tropica]SEK10425.1 hypothetical protein SAMN05216550_1195 [Paraburkholderia tropica]